MGCSSPTRLHVAILSFVANFIYYANRVNISVCIIAMVKQPDPSKGANSKGPHYNWDEEDQSLVLGSFFYGYILTQLAGGPLSERYGGRLVIFTSLFLVAICTLLGPLMAHLGLWAFVASRVGLGISSGVMYPSMQNIISKWAPPVEKGKFMFCLFGGTLGTVATWCVVGSIIESIGWVWVFYLTATVTCLVSCLWLYVVADNPLTHPRISEDERSYIIREMGAKKTNLCPKLPVRSILTSVPFWALCFFHFGNSWGLFFLLTAAPKFMSEVLKFKISEAGLLSALPYLVRLFAAIGFGYIGDKMREKKLLSVTAMRKLFSVVSHILPGILLSCVTLVNGSPYKAVALMTLSLGLNGCSVLTSMQNPQDLAPNFAGSISGFVNFFGTMSGFLSPMLVAHFTGSDPTSLGSWTYVFLMGGGMYVASAIIFILFGSGEIQPWNRDPDEDNELLI